MLMLAKQLRCWTNIKTSSFQRVMFAGLDLVLIYDDMTSLFQCVMFAGLKLLVIYHDMLAVSPLCIITAGTSWDKI